MAPKRRSTSFLDLAVETRLNIYDHLLTDRIVRVEIKEPDRFDAEPSTMQMKPVDGLSPQLIRVCRQVAHEANLLLYSSNVFDCSQRDGIDLLMKQIGPARFCLIRHIMLDWDQLQILVWKLSQDADTGSLSGLETISMATWRTRVLGGSSFVWKQNRRYERHLCEAARDILQKHPKLNMVVQSSYHRPAKYLNNAQTARIKWRFITSQSQLMRGETVVNLEEDLSKLKSRSDVEDDGETSLLSMDPF